MTEIIKCKKCLLEKECFYFSNSKTTKNGKKASCKQCVSEYDKLNYQKNKDKIKESSARYKKENRDKVLKQKKEYDFNHKKERNKKRMERFKKRMKTDSFFKLKNSIRKSIINSIKRKNFLKKTKTEEILGCSFEEFKKHLELKFEPWMNWENYGNWNGTPKEKNVAWDIDHIIPIDSAKNEEDLLSLNYYKNLRPFCSYTNRWIKKNIF